MTTLSRERWPLILGLWAVPVSIAAAEFFLSVAALLQLVALLRRQTKLRVPRSLWFLFLWFALELVVWSLSSEPSAGWSEIRHILLVVAVLLALSAMDRGSEWVLAWKGVFVSATLSSIFLIGEFFYRLRLYRAEIAAGGDSSFYLRSGGLLHHWMVYGTVEILVFAGLIVFWTVYRSQRSRLWPVVAINGVAIVLSLTRMTWIACLTLLAIHLIRLRSKWILALPAIPLVIYATSPVAVRSRAANLVDPGYYSNAERVQMAAVGFMMLRDHPMTGVGPGRVDRLYESYLEAGDPVPAYHGHLHNNLIQIAAQFGIAVTIAALLFVACVFRDLWDLPPGSNPDVRFLSQTAFLAWVGFLLAGMVEYTYGHSLGLIMIAFAVWPGLKKVEGLNNETT